MGMAASDSAFVEKRRKLVKAGPILLGVCLVLVIASLLWLWFQQPQMINFAEVARQIESGDLGQLSVELMAVMLPIAMLMCFVVTLGLIGLSWAWLSNERRYLRIIAEIRGD